MSTTKFVSAVARLKPSEQKKSLLKTKNFSSKFPLVIRVEPITNVTFSTKPRALDSRLNWGFQKDVAFHFSYGQSENCTYFPV